jgi:membrane-associated phospholipid phosphatase
MIPAPKVARPQLRRASHTQRVLTDLARIFSTIFNPFLTALALFTIIAHEKAVGGAFWFLFFASTFFTSIAPMLYVLWLYATQRITDLDMSVRAEREKVFGAFVICYGVGTFVLYLMHAPTLMIAAMAGFTAASFVVQIITKFWKISTHALGVTAPLIVLLYMYGLQPLPFLLIVPLVGWSRVWLRAHTVWQVIAGTGLGAVSVLFFLRVFRLV